MGDSYASVMAALLAGPTKAHAILSRQVPAQFTALEPLVPDADVVLTGSIEFATPTLAEAAGKPRRSVIFSPAMVPGSAFPMPFLPIYSLPNWLNRLTWWCSDLATTMGVLSPVHVERRRRGLPKIKRASLHIAGSEVWVPFPPELYAMDARGFTAFRQMGSWHDEAEVLPPSLLEFLGNGPPPVYIGVWTFGAGERALGLYIDAARRLGLRMIVQGKRTVFEQSHDTYWLESPVSHRTLFPQCACIVHHGGAGTTIAAVASGQPQVVVPFIADQHFHARLIRQSGLGLAMARWSIDGASLAAAITRVRANAHPEHQPRIAAACDKSGTSEAISALEALA